MSILEPNFCFDKSDVKPWKAQKAEFIDIAENQERIGRFESLLKEKQPDKKFFCEFKVGSQDVKVKVGVTNTRRSPLGGASRSRITGWSRKSRSRCEAHIRNVPDGSIGSFLTLTYPEKYSNDGRSAKKHLDLMIKQLKRFGIKSGVWFLEFQQRGAPHFHLFLPEYREYLKDDIAAAWFRIVGSKDEKHLRWHKGELSGRHCYEKMRKPHAASYYASKYAVKAEQKDVPEDYLDVGRFWGYWGEMKPSWNYVHGKGGYSHSSAVCLIRNFKQRWGGEVSLVDGAWYSTTLRGAAPDFESLIDDVGWFPF